MKRSTVVIFAAVVIAVVAIAAAILLTLSSQQQSPAAQTFDLPDLGGREVRVAVENAYPPFNFITEAGEGAGWDYDALREICTRLNCTPVFVEADWEGIFERLANLEYDVVADGASITEERRLIVDFSEPYQVTRQLMVTRSDETRFSDATSLAELAASGEVKVGAFEETTNFTIASELVGVENVIAYTNDFDVLVEALRSGEVAAVVVDEQFAQTTIDLFPADFQVMGEPLFEDQLALVFPKESELLDPFNQALESMRADGTLERLDQQWFESFDVGLVE